MFVSKTDLELTLSARLLRLLTARSVDCVGFSGIAVLAIARLRCIYNASQFFSTVISLTRNKVEQVGQISQTNRAAACVSFGKNISAKSVHLRFFFRFVTITRLTDRETERQTTDSIFIARPRLHSMQRGKNGRFAFLSLIQGA